MDIQSLPPLELLKILGHDLRWNIVTTLMHSDYKVQELVGRLGQPQNLVSYHLKQLRDSHLLREHRSTADGRDIYYSLDLQRLQMSYDALGIALHPALATKTVLDAESKSGKYSARILFLCTENSARSQMAEGLSRHLGGKPVQVFSAGTAPSRVHPNAIRSMRGRGIDIASQRSKSVDGFKGQSFDYVITVCDRAREQCPTFAEATTLIHWSLSDPALAAPGRDQAEAFEQTAQDLEVRIRYLLKAIRATNGVHQ